MAAFAVVLAAGIAALVGWRTHGNPPDVAPPVAAAQPSSSPTGTSPTGSTPSATSSSGGGQSITLGQLHSGLGSQPVSVSVPSVHIAGSVIAVGTDPRTGLLEIPDNVSHVVWWSYGARPGQSSGAVVLAAHVDYNGALGIFYPLDHTPIGATVAVRLHDGKTVDYRVDGRQHVVKKQLSTLGVFTPGGSPRLVLITCGGSFDAAAHSYRDNVVVTAHPVTS